MWIRMVAINTISRIFTTGNVAMKCAALLKGSDWFFSSSKLIPRCIGRNVTRKSPASAITNFLEIEEYKTLFIGYEMFTVYFTRMEDSKIVLLNNSKILHANYHKIKEGFLILFVFWILANFTKLIIHFYVSYILRQKNLLQWQR